MSVFGVKKASDEKFCPRTVERALVLSPSEGSDVGCRYPDPSESVEFPGNSPGKSHELGCMSTSVPSVVWLCRDIIDSVKAFNKVYFR